MVVAAATYLGLRDKLDSTDLTIILGCLGGGVSLPWVLSSLAGKKGSDT